MRNLALKGKENQKQQGRESFNKLKYEIEEVKEFSLLFYINV